ncbi:uncharacterized protein C8Q71DRAFT_703827 [Rhodofomes roseus]|uniref:Reverse transcriptase zinc-binding domain-containing protein n=1 Tax=Rhodofomes roseus TaxID=34475 RepID=A0ABQ8KL28_9APHY|nr:uncharacterized protein C8Q71DRAFT_703827 [Rhodofomes roseus]KAH9839013.1 hypothetical protein C8Q71DRAFT_703827 [Rhodofomes roseus]
MSVLVRPAPTGKTPLVSQGETAAALRAVQDTPRDVPLHLVLSSMSLAKQLVAKLPVWEDRGWIGVEGAPLTRALVNQLRQRCAPTTLRKVACLKEFEIRNEASELAKTRFLAGQLEEVAPTIDRNFDLSGAKLASLTQAIAYRGIMSIRDPPNRPRTVGQVGRTLNALGGPASPPPPAQLLWRSIRDRDIHRRIVDFLWKGLHDALKIGAFWAPIRGFEDRADCQTCGARESLGHILAECRVPGQDLVWSLTGALWKKKAGAWKKPSVEEVLAVGLGCYPKPNNAKTKHALARLWRIVISESAYLIWKLRCERVIEHSDEPGWTHSKTEITRRWYSSVNRRLQIDLIATRKSFGRLAKSRLLVLSTWTGTISDELGLVEDWTKLPRFLVGIDPDFCRTAIDPG